MRITWNRNTERVKWSPWSCGFWIFAALTMLTVAAILETADASSSLRGGSNRPRRPTGNSGRDNRPRSPTGNSGALRQTCNPSNAELNNIATKLWEEDEGRIANFRHYLKINGGCSGEEGLFHDNLKDDPFWNRESVKKFVFLLENGVSIRNRDDFLNAAMDSTVMRSSAEFLLRKRCITSIDGLRQFIEEAWFGLYNRGYQSSGFSHVFVGEHKVENQQRNVCGFHSWIRFHQLETSTPRRLSCERLTYRREHRNTAVGRTTTVGVKTDFALLVDGETYRKAGGTMLLGTTPEFDLALYTICFLTRANRDCLVELGGASVNIETYKIQTDSGLKVRTAYPTFPRIQNRGRGG